jgi:hypothetical protein
VRDAIKRFRRAIKELFRNGCMIWICDGHLYSSVAAP